MLSDEYSQDHNSERIHAARVTSGASRSSPTSFGPNRRRVFKLLAVVSVAVFLCYGAIYYGALGQRDWNGLYVLIFVVASVILSTWRVPVAGVVSVSNTEISDSRGRTIRLENLDRIRSSKRSLYDRVNGRQHLYSADGRQISLLRVWFDPSDLRKLLDLLQLDEGSIS
jgi:hypothetical protein